MGKPTPMRALADVGQSVWLDDLSRGMTRSGALQTMIEDGLLGLTSNPAIFERAIAAGGDYDADLSRLGVPSMTGREAFEALSVADVREAADLFLGVYEATGGRDGFVSLEVSLASPATPQGR